MSNKKALILTAEGNIKTFNSNNVWKDTSLVKDNLTDQDFIDQGFDPDLLTTSLTNIYVNFIDMGVLDTTGTDTRHLWLSEDISKDLNVSAHSYIDSDTQPKDELTISAFIPKDQLTAGYSVLIYTADTAYVPEITSTIFSASTTHTDSIQLTASIQYLFNKQIKYRLTIGSTVSAWSAAQNATQEIVATITPGNLQVGVNNITLEVADALDETKIGSSVMTGAITLTDAVPSINVINADSDSFYVHFIINDVDTGDQAQYQLTLTNSKGSNVVVPWTTLQSAPLDINYQIASDNIVVGETNVLTIDFKDNYGKGSSTTYTFTGDYKNILFVDENGSFYTTDKGILLKLLNFGKIFSGRSSDVKKLSLQNNNPYSITGINISKRITSDVSGAYVELSKSNNPFISIDTLDYGDQVLAYKAKIDFYVRIRTAGLSQGIEKFAIDALATQSV